MSNDALAKATLEFTAEQRKLIRDSFANGATDSEFGVLMEVARARRLNPLLNQIHFVKRWNQARGVETWATQVGIDGLRAIAERTGRYDGQDEPEFEYDAKGGLKSCRVRVYRKDISRAFVGVAFFGEYAQTKRDGSLTNMWATKPRIMLSKCAEALALRKGFPEDMAGLYVPEEMGVDAEREINPPPPPPAAAQGKPPAQSKTEAVKAQLLAKGAIIDVKPGETEAQAEARMGAVAAQAMAGIEALREKYGLRPDQMPAFIKAATGKTSRPQLVLEDVAKVESAIEAIIDSESPPPPSDADAPAASP